MIAHGRAFATLSCGGKQALTASYGLPLNIKISATEFTKSAVDVC